MKEQQIVGHVYTRVMEPTEIKVYIRFDQRETRMIRTRMDAEGDLYINVLSQEDAGERGDADVDDIER